MYAGKVGFFIGAFGKACDIVPYSNEHGRLYNTIFFVCAAFFHVQFRCAVGAGDFDFARDRDIQ